MILVSWSLADGKTGQTEFPDNELQAVMDRVNKQFGDPNKDIGGPHIESDESQGNAYDRAAHQQDMARVFAKTGRVGKKPSRG